MEIEISVTDAQVRAMLERSRRTLDAALQGAMRDATSLLLRQVRVYPSPPADSTCKRTLTLARSWFIPPFEQTADGLTGRVVNNGNLTRTRSGVPYARYVQDREMQAYMHRGRWDTYQDIAERSEGDIRAMFAARIQAAVGP